jgi:hypothetical protein
MAIPFGYRHLTQLNLELYKSHIYQSLNCTFFKAHGAKEQQPVASSLYPVYIPRIKASEPMDKVIKIPAFFV